VKAARDHIAENWACRNARRRSEWIMCGYVAGSLIVRESSSTDPNQSSSIELRASIAELA